MAVHMHVPPNKLRIDKLWAWLSVDKDGNEGVCATTVGNLVFPLIAADEDRLAEIREFAQEISEGVQGERKLRLICFSNREEIETL
jgi:hypothetical protein